MSSRCDFNLHVGAELVEGRGRDQAALAVDLPGDRGDEKNKRSTPKTHNTVLFLKSSTVRRVRV